jgi:hypothetical protein
MTEVRCGRCGRSFLGAKRLGQDPACGKGICQPRSSPSLSFSLAFSDVDMEQAVTGSSSSPAEAAAGPPQLAAGQAAGQGGHTEPTVDDQVGAHDLDHEEPAIDEHVGTHDLDHRGTIGSVVTPERRSRSSSPAMAAGGPSQPTTELDDELERSRRAVKLAADQRSSVWDCARRRQLRDIFQYLQLLPRVRFGGRGWHYMKMAMKSNGDGWSRGDTADWMTEAAEFGEVPFRTKDDLRELLTESYLGEPNLRFEPTPVPVKYEGALRAPDALAAAHGKHVQWMKPPRGTQAKTSRLAS